jgi:type I restriction enzyme, R subunit
MNKKDLSERDICSKFIGPAVKRAGWDGMMQIREEVAFTKGRIIVRGKLVTRGKASQSSIPFARGAEMPLPLAPLAPRAPEIDAPHPQTLRRPR